jgi:1,4-alpha-glucan branching enzyme
MAKRNHTKNGRMETGNGRTQTFSLAAPTAMSVQLVGDFTQWQQEPINLWKNADGLWEATVELPPGKHQYRFLVDGQWHDDPECPVHEPNPFGGQDAVRQVA